MTAKDEKKLENKVLLFIMIFFVFSKMLTFRMFDLGGDAINYWFAAKHLFYGIPYGDLTHQTSRFGIILPMFASQLLFGTHPIVTALLPNALMALQIIIIYKIGVRIHSIQAGFIAVILFMLCPYVIRWSGQILPPAFEGPAVTISFYFLLRYYESAKKWFVWLFLSALMLFWAYLVKETAIYFMFGFLIAILMHKKNIKHALIYSGMLFALFMLETSLYYHFTGDILGRFSAVIGHHLGGEKLVPVTIAGLFERYTKSELFWRIPFYVYVVSALLLYRKAGLEVKGMIISGMIFFFLLLISVKSIMPLVPALPYKEQYLMITLPFILPIIAIGAIELVKKIMMLKGWSPVGTMSTRPYAWVCAIIIITGVVITSSGVIDKRAAPYYNNLLNITDHNLVRFFRYHALLKENYNAGVPIVSDYVLTKDDIAMFNKVQALMDKGKNLVQACAAAGITKRAYLAIRPNMPVKNLNALRKVFLQKNPLEVPRIHRVTVGNNTYHLFFDERNFIIKPNEILKPGARIVVAQSSHLDLTESVFDNTLGK